MKQQTIIAVTPRGGRIFLEGVFEATGRTVGQRYSVVFNPHSIHIIFDKDAGKRTVVASKGGVIDLQSKKVTQWAQGATSVTIDITPAQIILQRAA